MHDHVYFILVRPLFLGNIGSVARALKNFNFGRLRLIHPPKNYKDAEARKMAVDAFDVLKEAEVYASLSEALKDISLAIGTSSGKQRADEMRPFDLAVPSLCEVSGNNHVAIVFGDERNGLLQEDLQRCHIISTIPTNPNFPALNMAQAVGIAAYEVNKQLQALDSASTVEYSLGEADDEIFVRLDRILDMVSFTRTYNRKNVLKELRQAYQRMCPTTRESDLIRGALLRIEQSVSK